MSDFPYDINLIKELVKKNKIAWKEHVTIRMIQRNITKKEVYKCLLNGKIIEKYITDKPFPSCLVLGYLIDNKPLHVVCSSDGEYLYIITTYIPNLYKWENDFTTRKDVL